MVESRGTRSVCRKFSKGTVFKSAGIVDDERKQRMVEYSLVTPCVVDFLDCAAKVIRARGI